MGAKTLSARSPRGVRAFVLERSPDDPKLWIGHIPPAAGKVGRVIATAENREEILMWAKAFRLRAMDPVPWTDGSVRYRYIEEAPRHG